MSFGWWPVSFFFLFWEVTVWLICRDLWVLALIPPLPPIERCGVRAMSASCFPPGACSPSHSCASPCQPHLCPPHLAWRYHQMSPNVTNLCSLSSSSSLPLFMHCWTKCTLLTVTQPPHGPTGSLTLTLWSNQCLCKLLCLSCVGTARSHSFLCLFSPRNEGAPAHSCRWPGWPHRATKGQRRPPLFPGVWSKSFYCISVSLSLFQAYKCVSLSWCLRGSFVFMPLWSHMHVF